jgi:adenine-specific DNA methylase
VVELIPYALKDTPALIEKIFPAQKVSFEAQRERKAVQSQTLTGLGSYWKGRKPLILVRAIVLGSLLPQTEDAQQDLELFEMLMAFDIRGLSRRMVQGAIKPAEIAQMVELHNPWDYFNFTIVKGSDLSEEEIQSWTFPLDSKEQRIRLSWKRGLSDDTKVIVYEKALSTLTTYEERSLLCKRPEEVDQDFLYAPVWPLVNEHLQYLGINAYSIQDLVEQLGVLRYGHRTKVGDTFSGGGSIPFEAARLGCDAYASDLNPVACMLTWAALNLIVINADKRTQLELEQEKVTAEIEEELLNLGFEHDYIGNRAKAYLYCLETRCPETGWLIPMSPTWLISKTRKVVAKLVPDHENKRFNIIIESKVSDKEMQEAERGTIRDGQLVYILEGKTYTTRIKTLRGDFKSSEGATENKLRRWEKFEFMPRSDDIFQERLYCIQWITKETFNKSRQITFFSTVTEEDMMRERKVEAYVAEHLTSWQDQGLVPDMEIEPGDKTDEPIRTRGWTFWHHLFNPRCLMTLALTKKKMLNSKFCESLLIGFAKQLDWLNKGCYFGTGAARESISHMFSNQALNVLWNYGIRSSSSCYSIWKLAGNSNSKGMFPGETTILSSPANELKQVCDFWITDPPYADAVHYHEITEFFIAWLRKNPPVPFNKWTWDSRRALAIKGDGDDFRRGMINAYKAMNDHMPSNGMQCVMFTHQDARIWADMVGIFWAAGLQVVAAWYIATETTSELKKGGYVQGTVTLMLRKRMSGENVGFKQRLLPAVRQEVQLQIEQMMNLNKEIKDKMGEPVFNDSDLQMAGYAAALKVLTAYTSIGGEDVTAFALRPRRNGETTVVDEIIQQAAEAANSILVPEGLSPDTWRVIDGVQRFYLRMLDMETTGASKLDNYQTFAKAFRVNDYTKVMANMNANTARLKNVTDFTSRELTDSTEIGSTSLGRLIIALQQLIAEIDPHTVIQQLQEDLADFMELRPVLIDLVDFISQKSYQTSLCEAAEVLAGRLRNQRALGQY